MHYLLFYEVTPEYPERRKEFRNQHLALAWKAVNAGELILGGALADPIDSAVLLFQGESPEIVKRFVESDPYVKNGLVKKWSIREWTTVVGEGAFSPIRVLI